MWKPAVASVNADIGVSVPLRGLDMWKHRYLPSSNLFRFSCFSPLAGIRYVETFSNLAYSLNKLCFSPLAGIRYVETLKQAAKEGKEECFSPLAGIRYVETYRRRGH